MLVPAHRVRPSRYWIDTTSGLRMNQFAPAVGKLNCIMSPLSDRKPLGRRTFPQTLRWKLSLPGGCRLRRLRHHDTIRTNGILDAVGGLCRRVALRTGRPSAGEWALTTVKGRAEPKTPVGQQSEYGRAGSYGKLGRQQALCLTLRSQSSSMPTTWRGVGDWTGQPPLRWEREYRVQSQRWQNLANHIQSGHLLPEKDTGETATRISSVVFL